MSGHLRMRMQRKMRMSATTRGEPLFGALYAAESMTAQERRLEDPPIQGRAHRVAMKSAAGAAVFRRLELVDDDGGAPRPGECCVSIVGRERSVEDVENVCANRPLRRVGSMPIRVPLVLHVLA